MFQVNLQERVPLPNQHHPTPNLGHAIIVLHYNFMDKALTKNEDPLTFLVIKEREMLKLEFIIDQEPIKWKTDIHVFIFIENLNLEESLVFRMTH